MRHIILTLIFSSLLILGCSADSNETNKTSVDTNQPPVDSHADNFIADTSPPIADLIINEIMYAPKAVYDDKGEWIELFNRGGQPVELNGWTLRDNSFDKHVIEQSITIAPGQYIVLGNNENSDTNGGYLSAYEYADFQLRDLTGDSVQLVDNHGRLVDSVSFKVTAPWPNKIKGTSIERTGTDQSGSSPSNWTHALATYGDGDLGTPGLPNGVPIQTFEIDESVADWQSEENKASLHFSPDGFLEDRVIQQLLEAKTQIDMAFFNVRLPEVLDALVALQEDGVVIRVLLDQRQQELEYNTMGEDMVAAGLNVTLIPNDSAEEATMHHKFTVIDQERVLVGSANYSWTAFNKSDEDLLIVDDVELATRFESQIDDLVSGKSSKSPKYETDKSVQAWMGPADKPHQILIDAINDAKTTVFVAMFQMNYGPLIDALIEAKERGCHVAIILDSKQAEQEENVANNNLASANVPVFLMEKNNSEFSEMHSKFVVIDNERILMGSYNWTAMASFFNNETLIDIRDNALAYRATGKFSTMLATFPNANVNDLSGSTTPVEINFSVSNITLDADSSLRIVSVGSGPFTPPTVMNGTTITASLQPGTTLKYRYQVVSDTGMINEGGLNHVLRVPFWSGVTTISDIFRP